jgi:hypothetical protein
VTLIHRIALAVILCLALSTCSGPSLETFNDRGGLISYHIVNSNLNDVQAVAERYCAQLGKKAKLGTPAVGWDSMNVSFECVE